MEEALLVSHGFQRSWSAAEHASWPAAMRLLCSIKQSLGNLPMKPNHISQNKYHLIFLHAESWWEGDFLSKEAQTSRASLDWWCWGHGRVSLRKVVDSSARSVYLALSAFSPVFFACLHGHFLMTHFKTEEFLLIYMVFQILKSLQYCQDRWWFLMLTVTFLFCQSNRAVSPVERNGTLFFLEERTESWGSLCIL